MKSLPAGIEQTREKMRIAFIVPEDRHTGTFFRSHNLAIALNQLGHEVVVYSQSNVKRQGITREERSGVRYVLVPTFPGNRFVIGPVNPLNIARRFLFNVEPADVYHLFQPYPSAAIAWLSLRERRDGVFAYDWDDYWMNDEFGLKTPRGLNARVTAAWVRFLEPYLPSKCDLLSTLSHNISALAHRHRARNTTIIYNGVWPEALVSRTEGRRRLGLDPEATYAGTMGWSGESEWAFEALRRCADKFPNLRLACCGRDDSSKLNEFPDISDRVDMLGHLSEEQLPAFRCSIDLGLIPMADTVFNHYRLPYKLTDFLAAGTPVLASSIGETSVLATQLPGITTCAPNLDAWIRAFAESVNNLVGIDTPNRVGRSELLEHFHWMRIAEKLATAYAMARAPAQPWLTAI